MGGYLLKQLGAAEAIICVISSQIANVGESIIGAALQEKEGFQWVGSHSNYLLGPFYTIANLSSSILYIFWSVCGGGVPFVWIFMTVKIPLVSLNFELIKNIVKLV